MVWNQQCSRLSIELLIVIVGCDIGDFHKNSKDGQYNREIGQVSKDDITQVRVIRGKYSDISPEFVTRFTPIYERLLGFLCFYKPKGNGKSLNF